MKRLRGAAWNAAVVLVIVGWLVLLWFAVDWLSTPTCDPGADPVHCEQVTASRPGNK